MIGEPSATALDQTRAPYFQVLLDYVDGGVIPFHTPGHKQGIGMERAFRDFVGDNVLAIDLTQIRGLDDLLQPEEALVEAQELAAECFGAEQSFFLINGSTSGNQCMMMAALNPGDKIAIPRNSHKSAMGGLIMSGAVPVWMQPEVDEALHMDHTVTPADGARHARAPARHQSGLHRHPDLLRRGGRRGRHRRGRARARHPAAGRRGLGAALPLPPGAAALGHASRRRPVHQLDPQDAGLALADRDDARPGQPHRLDRLKAVYKLFLSTSPNLVLVASLDVARRQMALDGPALLSRTIEIASDARTRLNEIPRVYCFGEELEGRPGVFDLDPTKITITVKDLGYTGYEAEEILRRRYNVQVELADLFNVVALYTIGTTPEASDQLIRGVSELAREDRPLDIFSPSGVLDRRMKTGTYKLPQIPPIRLAPREAFLADTEFVPFKTSAGRVCAEVITPYPPGIPVLSPGEQITPEVIDYLVLEKRAGVKMQGPYDDELKFIRVVR